MATCKQVRKEKIKRKLCWDLPVEQPTYAASGSIGGQPTDSGVEF